MLRNIAFVPAPARTAADPAVVAGAAVLATVPMGADAFVFKGHLSATGRGGLLGERSGGWPMACLSAIQYTDPPKTPWKKGNRSKPIS